MPWIHIPKPCQYLYKRGGGGGAYTLCPGYTYQNHVSKYRYIYAAGGIDSVPWVHIPKPCEYIYRQMAGSIEAKQ